MRENLNKTPDNPSKAAITALEEAINNNAPEEKSDTLQLMGKFFLNFRGIDIDLDKPPKGAKITINKKPETPRKRIGHPRILSEPLRGKKPGDIMARGNKKFEVISDTVVVEVE